MSFPERPRVVLTGAGSGLGRALALALAPRGAQMVLSDIEAEPLEDAAEAARANGAEVVTRVADVAKLEEVDALRALAQDRFGGTDIVINNAGVAVAGPVGEVSVEDWRWQIDVNLFGVIHGCHVFAPELRARGEGYILNVASMAGLVSVPEMAPYNVTKAGVVALSRAMKSELQASGVVVSVLCPTFFQSGIHTRARTSQPRQVAMTEALVTGSRWTSEDIAQIALRDLERGKLHVLPQIDAKIMWRVQRLFPTAFQWLLGMLYASDLFDRIAERRRRKAAG